MTKVLILIDLPLESDARVKACVAAYRNAGFLVDIYHVKQEHLLKFHPAWSAVSSVLFVLKFAFLWMLWVVCVLPKFLRLWKNKNLSQYNLLSFRLPAVFWFETLVHIIRGEIYSRRNREILSGVELIHAHDLASLSFAQAVVRTAPKAELTYDAHELSPCRNRQNQSWLSTLLLTAFEALAIQKATNVISVCKPLIAYFRMFAGCADRNYIMVCNDFYRELEPLPKDPDTERIAVFYIGSFIFGRGIEELVKLVEAQENVDVYLFCPEDNERQRARGEAFSSLDRFHVYFGTYDAKARSISERYNQVFGWLWANDICLSYRFALPNKLFQYVAYEIPMLYPPGFHFSDVARTYGLGKEVTLSETLELYALDVSFGGWSSFRSDFENTTYTSFLETVSAKLNRVPD